MTDSPDDFGARLTRFREEKGWSQRELGVASGLDQGTISKFERRVKVNPEMATLNALAKALGKTVVELYPDVGDSAEDESVVIRRLPRALLDQLADERLSPVEIDALLAETARDGKVDYRKELASIRAKAKRKKVPTAPVTKVDPETDLAPMPPAKPRRTR